MNTVGKVLRIVAIVFLGLTSVMNLMGGVGTTCAAFGFTLEYRTAFQELQEYTWLYQVLVFTTIAIGLGGIWATYALAKGKPKAYRNSLIILIIGTLLAAVHYIASQTLRGSAAPANMKFFINAFTLAIFLVIRIPGIWKQIEFSAPDDEIGGVAAGGFAAIAAGGVVLSVASWAGPSHTYFGQNWVLVLERALELSGTVLILGGVTLLAWCILTMTRRALGQPAAEKVIVKD
jgi:hypothetical protein